jgi:two-component system sensor histidine kinase MprB
MSLRLRLALGLAALAAVSVVAVSTTSYLQTSDRLHDQVDAQLLADSRPLLPPAEPSGRLAAQLCEQLTAGDGLLSGYTAKVAAEQGSSIQCVDQAGTVASAGSIDLPVPAAEVRTTTHDLALTDQQLEGQRYRVVTLPTTAAWQIRIVRSLAPTEAVLAAIRDRSLMIGGVVITLAALLGWLIASRITRPIERLTAVAEDVAVTGELEQPVLERRRDEVGRLTRAFTSMLAALEASRAEQQRLVEDASHELRTPLTSLRTNIETLQRHPDLGPETRERVLGGLDAELKALTALTNELVELTVSSKEHEATELVDLDALVGRAVELVGRRSGRTINLESEPSMVIACPEALLRAVVNVLDNAVKFSDDRTTIDLATSNGAVTVRDRGIGFADGDLPYVFNRFYRAIDARSMPGSGLGLAIVRDVAETSGGSVRAMNHPTGGGVVTITLHAVAANERDADLHHDQTRASAAR